MVFDDIPIFKKHVREYAVMKKCMFEFRKADKSRAYLWCKHRKNQNCLWQVNAITVPNEPTAKIMFCNLKHTCKRMKGKRNPMCNSRFVADYMIKTLGVTNSIPKPMAIMKLHIWPTFRTEIPYWVAAEARLMILADLHGRFEESYTKIPSLVKEVKGLDD
ncbi:hypothetical protein MKW98_009106 [Papaver atlanticum]|uniref:Transposase MuDR plant domain-containing protein n=1 Tax=Papaver atlanticum TaxID=357466 RepID=A0AAD4T5H2_9MAGN|nr:hypothetical protein MKW98_009106 [Papaver atlanticum]